MKKFLQSLSFRAEFVVVVGVAFGYVIVVSVLRGLEVLPQKASTAENLTYLLGYELVVGGALALFLRTRGWTFAKLGFETRLWDPAIGLLLMLATQFLWVVTWYLTAYLSPHTIERMLAVHSQLVAGGNTVELTAAVSLVNSIFEEVFVCGYVISALKTARTPWFAINMSVAIRLLYHLYQGQMGVLSIMPMGLVFAIWFARTRRLCPLIVAHALMDFIALAHDG